MAISRSHAKKSPNQRPTDFYKGKQYGGAEGKTSQTVGDKLTGGPQREQVYGRKDLGK